MPTGEESLREDDLDPDPLAQFGRWFKEAVEAGLPEPNAMTLATATPDGRPSARVVLLKAFDERGFVLYSNYDSRKGRELAANPRAALVFHWQPLRRQVRIEGRVERVDPDESAAYFATRPLGAQLGAWASPQSAVIPSRDELIARYQRLAEEHEGLQVPLPPFWGGLRVVPEALEFWLGRESRLHDRLRYTRRPGGWTIERLAP
jgi:pyridoxamine 5'-phosphate oxidase